MRRVPSILCHGFLCGAAIAGCSKATPPVPPVPAPPAAVAVAEPPVAEKQATPAAAPVAAPQSPPPAARQAAAQAPAESPKPSSPDPSSSDAEPASPIAGLQKSLAAAVDKNARVVVIDEIAALGQKAKPALADLIACTKDADGRTRWHAARAIGFIGEDALSAMPTLLGLLGDEDPIVVTQAAAAVGLIREDDGRERIPAADAAVYASAVDPLVASTTHADPRVRRSALRTLRRLMPTAEQLAPLLGRQLADADPSVVMPALHTLADMDDDAVPVLIETLKDAKARYWAAVALTEIGPEAAPAIEPLISLAGAGEAEERMQALLALAAIGPTAAAASPVMIKSLESNDGAIRFAAAFALGSVRATDADSALERATVDNDPFLAEVAAWARAKIHPDDKALVADAVRRLRAGLKSDRPNERTAAASGLSDLASGLDEPLRQELAAEFAELLADKEPAVEFGGAAALIRLGGTSVDTLRQKLADKGLRERVLEVLAALGPAAKPAIGELIGSLSDSDPAIRGDAAAALAAIGPEAAAAVPTLVGMLAEAEAGGAPAAAYSAAHALGRIGTAARPALDTLRRLTGSKDEILATISLWATLKIAPDDSSLIELAVPAMRKALRAEQEIVRLEAAAALGDIGQAAAAAVPLLELVSEEDPAKAVRAAAAAALKKIKST